MLKQPPVGRMSERAIRSMLNIIRKRMRDRSLAHKQFMELEHRHDKLTDELKVVVGNKLRAQIQAAESPAE